MAAEPFEVTDQQHAKEHAGWKRRLAAILLLLVAVCAAPLDPVVKVCVGQQPMERLVKVVVGQPSELLAGHKQFGGLCVCPPTLRRAAVRERPRLPSRLVSGRDLLYHARQARRRKTSARGHPVRPRPRIIQHAARRFSMRREPCDDRPYVRVLFALAEVSSMNTTCLESMCACAARHSSRCSATFARFCSAAINVSILASVGGSR